MLVHCTIDTTLANHQQRLVAVVRGHGKWEILQGNTCRKIFMRREVRYCMILHGIGHKKGKMSKTWEIYLTEKTSWQELNYKSDSKARFSVTKQFQFDTPVTGF